MKKFGTAFTVMMICAALFTGCSDNQDKQTANTVNNKSAESDRFDQTVEIADNFSQGTEQKDSGSHENNERIESTGDSDSLKSGESVESESTEDYENGIDGLVETAMVQYENSCRTQWKFLMGCPYELDYNDMCGNAVRVKDVNSISEVMEDYGEVFVGNRPELLEKYIETQDGLYCYDGGRGSNIEYQGTDLITVRVDGDTAEFTAVSHYADPETGEARPDVEKSFVMVYTDGVWKTSVFTLPN